MGDLSHDSIGISDAIHLHDDLSRFDRLLRMCSVPVCHQALGDLNDHHTSVTPRNSGRGTLNAVVRNQIDAQTGILRATDHHFTGPSCGTLICTLKLLVGTTFASPRKMEKKRLIASSQGRQVNVAVSCTF